MKQIAYYCGLLLYLILPGQSSVCVAQKRPNVLFIIADDLSKNLGVYGEQAIKTPSIDKVAAQGVVCICRLNKYNLSHEKVCND